MERTYFLNGVVTGREWLRLGFITSGFNRICGPSDERLGKELIGGGADIRGGGGDAIGTGGEVCMGGW